MSGKEQYNDEVPPRDEAERRAEEFENAHHDRSGKGADKAPSSHSVHTHSVRQGGK